MITQTPDSIRKSVQLQAPRSAVWEAIGVAENFSQWSGMTFGGGFVEGEYLEAHLRAAAAAKQDAVPVTRFIDRLDPPRLMRVLWHPFPVDPDVDYSDEPRNSVSFTLEENDAGTLLVVEEAGFRQLPEERRQDAYEGNRAGWELQLRNLADFLRS